MQLSKQIKVGARSYSVVILDNEKFEYLLEKRNCHDSSVKSFIDYDDQLICVREALHADHKRELILHELLHACVEDSGVNLSDEICEIFIRALAPRLSSLLASDLSKIL